MSVHTATITWQRSEEADFPARAYSRAHQWEFDGGAIVPASASPSVVPLPYADAAAVDPEEAFVTALASCHMLWFLDLAARAGYVVDRYLDRPEGILDRNEAGKLAMTVVTLRPTAVFASQVPADEVLRLHRRAHEVCYLANSVVTDVRIDPQGVEQ